MIRGVIWLINPYGNIPGEHWTEYRFSMIARSLSSVGYKVRWFIADFEHRSKLQREVNEFGFEVLPGYYISVIKSAKYIKHVSVERIYFERAFATNILNSTIINSERPDLIIFSEPALFVSDIYKKIARKAGCSYVVDILDLWPEVFITILPKIVVKLERVILLPLYLVRSWFIKDSIGVTSVVPDYLDIIKDKSGTKKKDVIYIGIAGFHELDPQDNSSSVIPNKLPNEFWLVYSGTLGHSYDIDVIMKLSLRIRDSKYENVKIMIAGDGEMRYKLLDFITSNNGVNLCYLGKLDKIQLRNLYELSDIAISSYSKYSPVSMPLKAYDYFLYGLPIINSLQRELSRLVVEKEVGIQYQSGNVDSMWNAFEKLYRNEDLRNEMARNAKNLAVNFSYEVQYSKYVDFIEVVFKEMK